MNNCICSNVPVCVCGSDTRTRGERWKAYALELETENERIRAEGVKLRTRLAVYDADKLVPLKREIERLKTNLLKLQSDGYDAFVKRDSHITDLTVERDKWRKLAESVKEELEELHKEPCYDRGTLMIFLNHIELIFKGDK